MELLRLSSGGQSGKSGTQRQAAVPPPANSRWNESRMRDFFKLIEGKQRKLIDELLDHDVRTDEQLVTLLNLANSSSLGGVFSGLWKNAKKVGADPNEVYSKKPNHINEKKGFDYTLNIGFRHAAQAYRAAMGK